MTKGTALYNRFVKKPGQDQSLVETTGPEPPALAAPEPVDAVRDRASRPASDDRRRRIRWSHRRSRAPADSRALKSAGIEGDGARLIEQELEHPATAAELATAAKTPEMAVQAYTAARRVITPNSVDERVFLAHLSAALGLAPHIVAQIDAKRRWTGLNAIARIGSARALCRALTSPQRFGTTMDIRIRRIRMRSRGRTTGRGPEG